MRARCATLIVVGLAALGAAGCKSSARTIKMAGIEISTDPATELSHGNLVFCGSRDGRYFAEMEYLSTAEAVLQVRDYANRSLKLSIPMDKDGPVPLLFDKSCENFLVAGGKGNRDLVAYSLADGSRRAILTTDVSLDRLMQGASNADHTILAAPYEKGRTVLVTASGTVHVAQGDARFDPAGNAWSKEGGEWVGIDKEGRKTAASAPPPWLVDDQSRVRGPMRLVEQQQEIEHAGTSASVSVLWIECTKGGKTGAALLHVAPDPVSAYGFIPGRDAVYCQTAGDTWILPYTIQRAGR